MATNFTPSASHSSSASAPNAQDSSLQVQFVQIGQKTIRVGYFTGKVVSATKNMETRVSGSGGGGYSYQGTGYSSSVNITSTTVVHDQVFIQSRDGEEKAFQLQGFDLAVREGNILTVAVAMIEGKSDAVYAVAATNHTTRTNYVKDSAVKEVARECVSLLDFRKNISMKGLVGVGLLAIPTSGLGLFAYPFYVILVVVPQKAKELKSQIQFPQVEHW